MPIVFGYFDLAQAEARIVGWRANIPKWKKQFEQARKDGKYDAHRALASDMFHIPYDQVPLKDHDEYNQPTIRYTAKRCRHGLNYRMERFKLHEVLNKDTDLVIPYHQAMRAFVLYHQATPELRKWWEQEEKTFKSKRELFSALGRRLKVIQRIDDDVLSSIVAFYPQSTIGDKIIQVWYQSESDDKWPSDARVAIDVHDNLVVLAPDKKIKTALSICKKYAESPITVIDAWGKVAEPRLIIPAECKISYPTVAVKRKDGSLSFERDPKGKHRWSHLDKIDL